MEQSRQPPKDTLPWNYLPRELRSVIVSAIFCSVEKAARYSSVCKEWQGYLEPIIFSSLTVFPYDISRFSKIFKRKPIRQAYLKRLTYWIALPESSWMLGHFNNIFFTKCISRLFKVLREWDVDIVFQANGKGIALELGFNFREYVDVARPIKGLERRHDLEIRDRHIYFGKYGLGKVEVVTCFKILRRSFAGISEWSRWRLLKCFPRLQEIRAELWPYRYAIEQLGAVEDLKRHLHCWPLSLRKISIFRGSQQLFRRFVDLPRRQDSQHPQAANPMVDQASNNELDDADLETGGNPTLDSDSEEDPLNDDDLDDDFHAKDEDGEEITYADIASTLAELSPDLEQLSVCNLIDAKDFCDSFLSPQACLKLPVWKYLRFLTLTSGLISEQRCGDELDGLLISMGKLASHMPILQVLELFNTYQDGAGIFQVVATDERATIKWASTWTFKFHETVKQGYKHVAFRGRHRPEFLPEEHLRAYCGPLDFMSSQLLTRCLALDPETLMQLTSSKICLDPLSEMDLRGRL